MKRAEIKTAIECMREDGYSDKEIEAELGVTVTPIKKARKEVGKGLTDDHKLRLNEGKVAKAREKREAKIREALKRNPSCRCGITPTTTDDELRAIYGHSCTEPKHICPTLMSLYTSPKRQIDYDEI